MSDTFDIVRVEGAKLNLPAEYDEFEFFVHNTIEQREDGTLLVHEDQYSVSEKESGSIIAEFEPSVAAAEALALKRITYMGPKRLRNLIKAAVQYRNEHKRRNSGRNIPYRTKVKVLRKVK